MNIDEFARFALGAFPTPLEPLPRLSALLGGPTIWVKRDDQTGLALGGNKVRKLELLLGDALAQHADVALTTGAAQSNHARLTAAAARRAGLDCILILRGDPSQPPQGNLLLDHLLGAQVRIYDSQAGERAALLARAAEEQRAAGRKPYVIPLGGSNGLGALAYAMAAGELAEQAAAIGLRVDHIVVSSSSGGTQGGLVLGCRRYGLPWKVWGISPDLSETDLQETVAAVASSGAALLGEPPFQPEQIAAVDGYVGPGYGKMTPECRQAIRLVAQTEGLLLDPVYTGKAMAGLVDLARRGTWDRGENVVFWHTGGTPALFAYEDELVGEGYGHVVYPKA